MLPLWSQAVFRTRSLVLARLPANCAKILRMGRIITQSRVYVAKIC